MDQMPRIGMLGCVENIGSASRLDKAARIHNSELVGQSSVNAHIMGYKQNRRSHFTLYGADHPEDFLLDDHIKSSRGFIGDDEIGPANCCQSNGDHLPHPARQFMRIGIEDGRIKSQSGKMIDRFCFEITIGSTNMNSCKISEYGSYLPERVEDIHRALHDIGELAPADSSQLRRIRTI